MKHGNVLPWKHRVSDLVDFIRQSDGDIVCLEEVYDRALATRLESEFTPEYSHFYTSIGHNAFCDSGLMVISKFAIEEAKFTSFHHHSLGHPNKGWFSGYLMPQNKRIARIFHTHLQHSQNDLSPSFAEKELRQIETNAILRDQVSDSDRSIPHLLIGDLNMKQDELQQLPIGKVFTSPKLAPDELDHILLDPQDSEATLKVELLSTSRQHLSDHPALRGTVSLK